MRRARGFTLIEVLVVMLLIGIILGMTTLYIGGDDDSAVKQESERLALLVQTAQQEAILQGTIFLLEVVANGYRFARLNDEDEFQVLEQDDILRAREMPVGVELQGLELEGAPERQPGVLLWPTGELTAFAVTFKQAAGNARWRVEGLANGEVKFARAS